MNKNLSTGLRIDKATLEKVDILAKKTCRTRSNMIRFIIEKYFESHAD